MQSLEADQRVEHGVLIRDATPGRAPLGDAVDSDGCVVRYAEHHRSLRLRTELDQRVAFREERREARVGSIAVEEGSGVGAELQGLSR